MTADPLAALAPMVEKLRAEQPDEPGNTADIDDATAALLAAIHDERLAGKYITALATLALWKAHATKWEDVARSMAQVLTNTVDHLSERPLTSEERDALRSTFREICEANGVTP